MKKNIIGIARFLCSAPSAARTVITAMREKEQMKLLPALFVLTLGLVFAHVQTAWSAYTGVGTFTKITSLADLSDGYYVIAYGTTFAMNNTMNANSYFQNTAIIPSGNTLTDPSVNIVWLIQTDSGGKTIYNETTAKYVSYTGSGNNAYAVSSVSANNERWTFAWASTVFTVRNLALDTRYLQYNTSSPRYACYLVSSAQQNLTLYKMATVTPTISAGSVSTFGNQAVNTTSGEKNYTVSGANLSADIIITPPVGFEIWFFRDFRAKKQGGSSEPETPLQMRHTTSSSEEQMTVMQKHGRIGGMRSNVAAQQR